jgi:hypothetical protein
LYPITVFADTKKAIELMKDASNTGLRPEVLKWYEEVLIKTYDVCIFCSLDSTAPLWPVPKKGYLTELIAVPGRYKNWRI